MTPYQKKIMSYSGKTIITFKYYKKDKRKYPFRPKIIGIEQLPEYD